MGERNKSMGGLPVNLVCFGRLGAKMAKKKTEEIVHTQFDSY